MALLNRKTLMAVLAVVMAISMAACSAGTPAATTAAATTAAATEAATSAAETAAESATPAAGTVDTSEKVEVVMWLPGDAPKGLDAMNAKLNEMLLTDLNCTVKFNFTTWTDIGTKYSMLLTSGQPIDLIHTANWLQDRVYARKGAFKPLNDLLDTVVPDLKAYVGDDILKDGQEDGVQYTIPCKWKEYIDNGVLYREDLRVKYNLPKPDSLANLEAYMAGIKANEPEMKVTVEGGVSNESYSGFSGSEVMLLDNPYITKPDNGLVIGLTSKTASYLDITEYYGSDAHKAELELMTKWAKAGYWSRNALSQKIDDRIAAFEAGECAVVLSGANAMKWNGVQTRSATANPDWQIGFIPYGVPQGYARPVQPTQNGMAVPLSSQNTERALLMYQKFNLDEAYNHLTHYGIEGTNYTIDAENHYVMVGTSDSNDYPREALNCWSWRNPDLILYAKEYDNVKALFAEQDKLTQLQSTAFTEDREPVANERAALTQVINQYLAPISAGLSKDVAGDYAAFLEKAKAAGLQKIQDEYKKQWLEYCNANGLK